MANTAALLGSLLNTNADINYYTQQQIFWANKQEANAKKLQAQVSSEDKWEQAYDSCYYADDATEIKIGATTYHTKEVIKSSSVAQTAGWGTFTAQRRNAAGHDLGSAAGRAALAYANAKAQEYDQELSIELAELDVEYDTMKCMYETLLETMRAQKDQEANATSTAAQDTCLLNAG